jgi:Cdc6-like AAA superfamily ATPase
MTPQRSELRGHVLVFPDEFTSKQAGRVLTALSGMVGGSSRLTSLRAALVFELWATGRGITYRLRIPPLHEAFVVRQLRVLVPGVRVTPEPTPPKVRWTRMVELGMKRLQHTLRVPEPDTAVAGLLASVQAGRGQAALVQCVVMPAVRERPPEPSHAVPRRGRHLMVIEDLATPEKAAVVDQRNKLAEPNWLAAIRIAVRAPDNRQAEKMLSRIKAALTSLQTPYNNFYKRLISNRLLRQRIATGKAPVLFSVKLSAPELAVLTGWPMGQPYVAGLPRSRTRHLPATEAIPRRGGPVLLASDFPGAERPLCITPEDLGMHLFVAGSTGTGKTTLLCGIAEQLAAKEHGLVIIETKGDNEQALFHEFIKRIPKHRVNDVIIVDVADQEHAACLNLLNEGNPRVVIEQICALFEHLYHDTRSVYSREAMFHGLHTLASRPGHTIIDLPALLSPKNRAEEGVRYELVATVKDPELQDFWRRFQAQPKAQQERFVLPVLDRFWQLNSRAEIRRLFGQTRSSFSLREVLEQNKLLLINFSGVGEATANLAGALIMNALWSAIKAAKVRKSNYLVLDEFAALLNLPVKLDELLARMRSYNTGAILATQQLTGMPRDIVSAIISNARSKVIMQGGGEDARLFAREFGTGLSEEDFKNLDRFQAIARLMAGGSVSGPMTGVTLPPSEPTGLASYVRRTSRNRYSRPVAAVEAEIRARRTPSDSAPKPKKPKIGTQKWE